MEAVLRGAGRVAVYVAGAAIPFLLWMVYLYLSFAGIKDLDPGFLSSSGSSMRSTCTTYEVIGRATAVFHTRSGNSADTPRSYTIEPHKKVIHGSAIGPVARLEFALEPSAHTINVELPRERFRELNLRVGEMAYLTPTRLHQFAAPA